MPCRMSSAYCCREPCCVSRGGRLSFAGNWRVLSGNIARLGLGTLPDHPVSCLFAQVRARRPRWCSRNAGVAVGTLHGRKLGHVLSSSAIVVNYLATDYFADEPSFWAT